jgi:prepilin-type N-terminal cleavage/methylation domain-containing protein
VRPYHAHTDAGTPSNEPLRRSSDRHDDGFTLVELIVAMVIMAILLAVAVSTFSGAKSNGYHKEAVATARSFESSIESFAADHNGRVPNFPDEFVNIEGAPGRGGLGARDTLTDRAYMRTPADGVKNGRIRFGGRNLTTQDKGVRSIIRYIPNVGDNQRRYWLQVVSPKAGEWTDTQQCYLGNVPPPTGEREC